MATVINFSYIMHEKNMIVFERNRKKIPIGKK